MFYLFHHFDLKFESIYETCATEIEPSIDDIISMHKTIIESNVSHVFIKELVSTSVAERLVLNTDIQLEVLHSGHNVSSSDFEKGITLLEIMRNNINALRKEINK